MFQSDQDAFEFLIGEVSPEMLQDMVTVVETQGALVGAELSLQILRDSGNWDDTNEDDAHLMSAIVRGLRYVEQNIAGWFLLGEVEFLDGLVIATFQPGDGPNGNRIRMLRRQMENFESN